MPKTTPRPKSGAAPERRRRRSAEDLTDRILEAAADEFKRSGYVRATTAAIARAADVTEAQIFRYYGSKAELFREAIFKPLDRQLLAFMSDLAPPSGGEDLHDQAGLYISGLQRFLEQNSEMLTSLVVAQKYDPEMAQGVGEMGSLAAYFEHGAAVMRRRLKTKPKVDPKLMVRVSFAAVLGCVIFKDWIFPPGLASDDKIQRAINDFVMDGVAANWD